MYQEFHFGRYFRYRWMVIPSILHLTVEVATNKPPILPSRAKRRRSFGAQRRNRPIAVVEVSAPNVERSEGDGVTCYFCVVYGMSVEWELWFPQGRKFGMKSA
jgi:hypothetical protein